MWPLLMAVGGDTSWQMEQLLLEVTPKEVISPGTESQRKEGQACLVHNSSLLLTSKVSYTISSS